MKTNVLVSLLMMALVGSTGCATLKSSTAMGGRVVVGFDHPEQFTDVKSQPGGATDPHILEQLRAYLASDASQRVPAADTLTVTFTDIDLAGSFEPWRITINPVRIVKQDYPPRASFSWALTDANGAVVRQGNEHLIDTLFLSQANFTRDPLFYDKQMLDGWVRGALPAS